MQCVVGFGHRPTRGWPDWGKTMSKYEVTLGEVIVHTITVPAGNRKEAIELAQRLIANEPDKVLKRVFDYRVDTAGWDGYEEAEELNGGESK